MAETHTKGSEFRAVENGVGYIKPTYDGLTEAVDYKGNVLLSSHTDDTGYDVVKLTDIPVEGVDTIYSKYGDIIDLCFAAFGIAMVLAAILRNRKNNGRGRYEYN